MLFIKKIKCLKITFTLYYCLAAWFFPTQVLHRVLRYKEPIRAAHPPTFFFLRPHTLFLFHPDCGTDFTRGPRNNEKCNHLGQHLGSWKLMWDGILAGLAPVA